MPQSMLQHSGWNGINFNSPFADLAILLGINWLAILLYIEAFCITIRYWRLICRRYRSSFTSNGEKWTYP